MTNQQKARAVFDAMFEANLDIDGSCCDVCNPTEPWRITKVHIYSRSPTGSTARCTMCKVFRVWHRTKGNDWHSYYTPALQHEVRYDPVYVRTFPLVRAELLRLSQG